MKKGGYKIVNFNGTALSSTPVTLTGIYDQIVDDYDKSIMVSGVSLNGAIMDDAYAGVEEKTVENTDVVDLTVYGGVIRVTEDDEVTFTDSKSLEELTAEIGDLDDLTTTDKDSAVDAINEVNGKVGNLSSLTTTDKDSSVDAINEVNGKVGSLMTNVTIPANTLTTSEAGMCSVGSYVTDGYQIISAYTTSDYVITPLVNSYIVVASPNFSIVASTLIAYDIILVLGKI